MSKITLTQSLVQKYFNYHPDGYLIRKKINQRSHPVKIGDRFGSVNKKGYILGKLFGIVQREHRLIYLYHYGYLPKEIDHINNIKHDNRIENLRSASSSQNSCNRTKQVNNASGYKGVVFKKSTSLFVATIQYKKVRHYLGAFSTAKEAHTAYCEVSEKYHGKFGHT